MLVTKGAVNSKSAVRYWKCFHVREDAPQGMVLKNKSCCLEETLPVQSKAAVEGERKQDTRAGGPRSLWSQPTGDKLLQWVVLIIYTLQDRTGSVRRAVDDRLSQGGAIHMSQLHSIHYWKSGDRSSSTALTLTKHVGRGELKLWTVVARKVWPIFQLSGMWKTIRSIHSPNFYKKCVASVIRLPCPRRSII